MTRFQNIIDDFNESIHDVAFVWQSQRENFKDKKIEDFGVNVLRPVSDSSYKINSEAERLKETLKKLVDLDLIDYY